MRWGKQTWYCPNCGQEHYSENLADTTKTQAYQCSRKCYDEWEMKYTKKILGKDGPK